MHVNLFSCSFLTDLERDVIQREELMSIPTFSSLLRLCIRQLIQGINNRFGLKYKLSLVTDKPHVYVCACVSV